MVPLKLLYSLLENASNILNNNGTISGKYFAKLSPAASAHAVIAEIEFSLTIEIPLSIKVNNLISNDYN